MCTHGVLGVCECACVCSFLFLFVCIYIILFFLQPSVVRTHRIAHVLRFLYIKNLNKKKCNACINWQGAFFFVFVFNVLCTGHSAVVAGGRGSWRRGGVETNDLDRVVRLLIG